MHHQAQLEEFGLPADRGSSGLEAPVFPNKSWGSVSELIGGVDLLWKKPPTPRYGLSPTGSGLRWSDPLLPLPAGGWGDGWGGGGVEFESRARKELSLGCRHASAGGLGLGGGGWLLSALLSPRAHVAPTSLDRPCPGKISRAPLRIQRGPALPAGPHPAPGRPGPLGPTSSP